MTISKLKFNDHHRIETVLYNMQNYHKGVGEGVFQNLPTHRFSSTLDLVTTKICLFISNKLFRSQKSTLRYSPFLVIPAL